MINTISITDLKQNTAKVIKGVQDDRKSVVILQRSQKVAVIVDPSYYEILEEALENAEDIKALEDRIDEPTTSFDDVAKKLNMA